MIKVPVEFCSRYHESKRRDWYSLGGFPMGIDLGIEFYRMRNGSEEEQEIKVDFKQKGKEWR